jgi:hypothetical protein
VGFVVVVAAYMGSEVPEPGLPRRSTLIGAQIGNGVIDIDRAAHRGGVGKHIGGEAELQLFSEPGWDLVGIDWGVAGGEVDDRFEVDTAVITEYGV